MGLARLDIVTMDGPAGAGKSSVARTVARQLGYTFLDTGAMYRAIAYGAVAAGICRDDTSGLEKYLSGVNLQIQPGTDLMRLALNGTDVTELIRSPEMGQHASNYSTVSAVRTFCSRMQRQFGETGRVVCEGRDMGTVVFPDARWKFFLTASVDARAKRRWLELKQKGEPAEIEAIKKAIASRDDQDSGRAIAPLKPADDAHIVDTTEMSFEMVVRWILDHVTSV